MAAYNVSFSSSKKVKKKMQVTNGALIAQQNGMVNVNSSKVEANKLLNVSLDVEGRACSAGMRSYSFGSSVRSVRSGKIPASSKDLTLRFNFLDGTKIVASADTKLISGKKKQSKKPLSKKEFDSICKAFSKF